MLFVINIRARRITRSQFPTYGQGNSYVLWKEQPHSFVVSQNYFSMYIDTEML